MLAACVAVLSAAVLHSSFDPAPAGENIAPQSTIPLVPILQDDIAPLPPEVTEFNGEELSSNKEPNDTASGGHLNSQETIKFCMLLLQDGARLMESVNDYSVVFHKEERINGDLKPSQMIDMKVQHKPHFAVYMKWLNGERGRQVLYSDEYEDKCLSLKFGGFKKMFPALRVDPNCSSAKAESRYPITEAGVLSLIQKLLKHRERDLELGQEVNCVRLANREFDGRDCYQFMLTYSVRQTEHEYRKHLVMIDTVRHLPVIVQNYTWCDDASDLTARELDDNTLVENYSFTSLNLQSKLVALDFSRDNPGYRM